MDDCYHEVRCRDVPFIENGYYGIVLSHRSTSKRFFSQENRFLSTPSKSVKMVTFPSLKEKQRNSISECVLWYNSIAEYIHHKRSQHSFMSKMNLYYKKIKSFYVQNQHLKMSLQKYKHLAPSVSPFNKQHFNDACFLPHCSPNLRASLKW